MIPEYAIREWGKTVPWNSSAQVEQDLIICRALVALFNDEYLASHLAFRGGTTLHKLYIQPQARYSEDIDLVQITAEPIKETLDRIRCYRRYMEFVVDKPPTQKEYLQNMELKMSDEEFLGDTNRLLRPNEIYNPYEAYKLVKSQLIERL